MADRWQDQFAIPNWQDKLTKLNPDEEQAFQQWAQANQAPITDDYDMRGFWQDSKNNPQALVRNPNDNLLHYPDTHKTPLHESFSGESKFADPATNPPMWNEQDQLVRNGSIYYDEKLNAYQRELLQSLRPNPPSEIRNTLQP